MVTLYVKKQYHYESIPNTPANADRIRELTSLDPVTLPKEFVIPWCVETESADPVCNTFKEFRERYELAPEEPPPE